MGFAGDVANASRALGAIPAAARGALVASLSSVVDAGYLRDGRAAEAAAATDDGGRARRRRRRAAAASVVASAADGAGAAAATAAAARAAVVSDVLYRVHLLSLSQVSSPV